MVTKAHKSPFRKNFFELQAWAHNNLVCGIDEVGRGCLAGPVVASAVILYPHKKSPLIKDSKLLKEEELMAAYQWIITNAFIGIGIVSAREIDTHNIYQATLRAMKRAYLQLMAQSTFCVSVVLVDAMPLALVDTIYKDIDVLHFPFGESKSVSIAAASIVAKVSRDRLMKRLSTIFSPYGLHRHKGYGTSMHRAALAEYGSSLIHRATFLKNNTAVKKEIVYEDGEQQRIC